MGEWGSREGEGLGGGTLGCKDKRYEYKEKKEGKDKIRSGIALIGNSKGKVR